MADKSSCLVCKKFWDCKTRPLKSKCDEFEFQPKKIRCGKCGIEFDSEEDLSKILISINGGKEVGELYKNDAFRECDDQEVINGCPTCLTDGYLQDTC